jgi:SAM-dependent methyltransferase
LNKRDITIIHGRSYTDGNYWVPNDEKQENQLDIEHHLYRLILGGQLYLAPIGENPRKVLDIGTGTGIWAVEFADQHPSAQVIGFDLSPVYKARVKPNVLFEVKDAREPWDYEPSSFDFIHARGLNGCVSAWPIFYERAFAWVHPWLHSALY